ncbi:HIStone family member (his-48)-like protein [Perkinsela sp. CCAP 1560/4]|nr:HIStone family member (his-48)-like protein [Perkinsela sp. CCAP 1560/4]|eukprot:KNH04238.1 HIStone family member (his-48)-like protein [Perkinsela sp. CCAP 1560/4]
MASSQKVTRTHTTAPNKRKSKQSFNRYIHKTLKQIYKDIGFSKKGMAVMSSFVNDIFERLAVEAASLTRYNKAQTMSSIDIQTAVRLSLPGELAKHAMAEGTKAVARLAASK